MKTHYQMISNRAETACGLSDVLVTKDKAVVSCADCRERITRWGASRDAAKAAWATRVAALSERSETPHAS